MLKISTDNNNIVIAAFDGDTRFNSLSSQEVKDELSKVLKNSGTKLILDLEGIKFIDSSAFGSLIAIVKVSKQTNSFFKMCNAADEVKELISVMQLDSVFEVFADLSSCKASF